MCIHTYLTVVLLIQQYVPGSEVSVDETLLGEVVHSISYLLAEGQQLECGQSLAVAENRIGRVTCYAVYCSEFGLCVSM